MVQEGGASKTERIVKGCLFFFIGTIIVTGAIIFLVVSNLPNPLKIVILLVMAGLVIFAAERVFKKR